MQRVSSSNAHYQGNHNISEHTYFGNTKKKTANSVKIQT